MKWIVLILLMLGLFAWAGMREEAAEEGARGFCDSVLVGESFAALKERAQSVGEPRLRFINEDSITVGFTGIPPFSRHACEVTSSEGLVDGKQYFYID